MCVVVRVANKRMRLGAVCLLLVSVCLSCGAQAAEVLAVPGVLSVARQGGVEPGPGRVYRLAQAEEEPSADGDEEPAQEGGDAGPDEEAPGADELGGPAYMGAEPKGVNVVANNVALVSWLQAGESYDPSMKCQTVGALIATNAIVCAPSVKVPVNIQNTSNWNVYQVQFAQPPMVVEGKNLLVVYHPNFNMDKDASSRIALVMLLPDAEHAASSMIPIKMVAAPFLPMVETTRHDDYSLSHCVMVVPNDHGDGVVHVEMSAVMCRHERKAKAAFHDRVCAYTKMMRRPAEVMSRPIAFPRDMGNPLICGNLLVGIYAGIQNIRGTYHKEAGPDGDQNIQIGGKRLSNEEQYTFDIPGAPKNFEFLSAFVNEEQRKMRWEQKLDLKDTNECLVEETKHGAGPGPVDDGNDGGEGPIEDDPQEVSSEEGEEGGVPPSSGEEISPP